MAPKRKQNAAQDAKLAKRRSKMAKEHNISADDEEEILEVWAMFSQEHESDSKHGIITPADAKRGLIALNTPPKDNAEWKSFLEILDNENLGYVEFGNFYAVAAAKLASRGDDPELLQAEVKKAYDLFTGGQDREINISDLKRTARALREDVPDSVLRDMIREATGGELGTVNTKQFEDVMRRAGVFT